MARLVRVLSKILFHFATEARAVPIGAIQSVLGTTNIAHSAGCSVSRFQPRPTSRLAMTKHRTQSERPTLG